MLDLQSVIHGEVPAVNPLHVQRLWLHQSQHSKDSGISYATNAILQICESESADPLAIWARTALIAGLLQGGFLENWRENDGLHKAVFHAAAVFPLPNGLQAVNPREFVDTLPAQTH